MLTLALAGQDYYKLLGVKRNADETEIRRAFKKLSLKYHPDKNKDNPEKAKKKFIEIANAYEVLSDPEKRKTYDQFGEEGVNQKTQRDSQGGQGGGFGQNMNYDDIFKQFFGGGGGGGNFNFNFGGGGHQGGGRQAKPQAPNPFENSDVVQLTMDTLSKFYRRDIVWVIYFYKPQNKNVENVAKELKEMAEKMYNVIGTGAVDCEENEEI